MKQIIDNIWNASPKEVDYFWSQVFIASLIWIVVFLIALGIMAWLIFKR